MTPSQKSEEENMNSPTKEEVKLKSCPFCGSDNIRYDPGCGGMKDISAYCECRVCYARGPQESWGNPDGPGYKSAHTQWNSRPLPEQEDKFPDIKNMPLKVRELIDIYEEAREAIGKEKAMEWILTPNPLFGEVSPLIMLLMGRYEKLKDFVDDALSHDLPSAPSKGSNEPL